MSLDCLLLLTNVILYILGHFLSLGFHRLSGDWLHCIYYVVAHYAYLIIIAKYCLLFICYDSIEFIIVLCLLFLLAYFLLPSVFFVWWLKLCFFKAFLWWFQVVGGLALGRSCVFGYPLIWARRCVHSLILFMHTLFSTNTNTPHRQINK